MAENADPAQEWNLKIQPTSSFFELRLKELWAYRDLLFLFVRRDFISTYKQTLLGPLWFFIQPLLSSITFTFVFGKIAGIPTDGIPQILFYLTGLTCWNYFSECLTRTSSTFTTNSSIFGKVYFPRMVVPVSNVISNLFRFIIQFSLMLVFLAYYVFTGANVHPGPLILLTPVFLILMAGLGLGTGILVSSFTTKYRDFTFLLSFGVQLLMYTTPVIYPLSAMKNSSYKWLIDLNPMTPVIEGFRLAYLGAGEFTLSDLLYSTISMFVLLIVGLLIFNRVEKTFMDTV
jgi:lipopolysaccharide transport system permease protein